MTEDDNWSFPSNLQPLPAQLDFDLQQALQNVVRVRSEVPDDAFTASALGTERVGNGVVIKAGERQAVLTVGYLITEAQNVWLTAHDGRQVAGHALAYDQATGFGIILPLGDLDASGLQLGSAQSLLAGNEVIVMGHGGIAHALSSKVIDKREFAGYWEYLLDEALMVSPPHPQWGGTALVDQQGRLVGIGSLLVQELSSGDQFDANLFVPIDLLTPILDELLNNGKVQRPPRPWLGLYTTEQNDELLIAGVTDSGPAHEAQLRDGDIITHVAKQAVQTLPQFYRTLWAQGTAGTMITLGIKRGNKHRQVMLRSASRDDYLLKPKAH
ncbi:MAG: S1C family serine protease [Steroidobacteraceae bacterium]